MICSIVCRKAFSCALLNCHFGKHVWLETGLKDWIIRYSCPEKDGGWRPVRHPGLNGDGYSITRRNCVLYYIPFSPKIITSPLLPLTNPAKTLPGCRAHVCQLNPWTIIPLSNPHWWWNRNSKNHASLLFIHLNPISSAFLLAWKTTIFWHQMMVGAHVETPSFWGVLVLGGTDCIDGIEVMERSLCTGTGLGRYGYDSWWKRIIITSNDHSIHVDDIPGEMRIVHQAEMRIGHQAPIENINSTYIYIYV